MFFIQYRTYQDDEQPYPFSEDHNRFWLQPSESIDSDSYEDMIEWDSKKKNSQHYCHVKSKKDREPHYNETLFDLQHRLRIVSDI